MVAGGAEQFLAGRLGGRVEPYGADLAASSMQVEAEASFTPGLRLAAGAAGGRQEALVQE